jgi:predicted N-acetyltransferase YhbS
MENIIIRKAISSDCNNISNLLNNIFYPEKVGEFSEVLFNHFPNMKPECWFLAEDKAAGKIVASFTLIPWEWKMEGLTLKVAELGLVGSRPDYRGKGLQRLLNLEFDKTVKEEGYDLCAIQGIPGFYHKFGYHYALPLNNHINLPLEFIPIKEKSTFSSRKATNADIPFLLQEDLHYNKAYSLSVTRSKPKWDYILGESNNTECGSDIWIAENEQTKEKVYFRILTQGGFGKGLILTEISVNASIEALLNIFVFLKKLSIERNKPFIRFDLPNDSDAGKYAISLGAKSGTPYAWQIKIPNKQAFIKKIKPVLENRIKNSSFRNFSGILRLNFYTEAIDLHFEKGNIVSIGNGTEQDCLNTFSINNDLFALLCLGYRSWQELQYIRPDVSASLQFVNPIHQSEEISGLLIDVLFPKTSSWIYEQY